jgi:Transmembrane amino acid transporter protein
MDVVQGFERVHVLLRLMQCKLRLAGCLTSGCACRLVVNSIVAAGIILIARFVPFLSVLMSLVGAFMTIFISILFPTIANLKMHAKTMGRAEKAWAVFVLVVGVACAVSGTSAALMAMRTMMRAA